MGPATMAVVFRADGDVEVSDLCPFYGPEEVVGLDVAVVEALPVEVNQPFGHLPIQKQDIFSIKSIVVDQIRNVFALDVLEEDVGRSLFPREHVGIDHPHDMRMFREADEGLVFLLEPLQG